ncbi:unnamed protein product [Pseudo-nitzschia multistriata]|uniref:DNA repair protein REV1 n=1 Tax=Pseudo-nitzschia multistriata TaxID=183589 RepID=A0A448ZNI7_9STRA|nr:unnamed protein product [Pseudo-nitzschia multistriata]
MVKPSKSMQPEHVDLQQASRRTGSGAAFGEDSFRNYMALKIAGQRSQFGLVLPPPPPPPSSEQQQQQQHHQQQQQQQHHHHQQQQQPQRHHSETNPVRKAPERQPAGGPGGPGERPTLLGKRSLAPLRQWPLSPSLKPSEPNGGGHCSSGASAPAQGDRSVRFLDKARPRTGPERGRTTMESVIRRLKRRHGRGNKRLGRKKARNETQEPPADDEEEEPPSQSAEVPAPEPEDSLAELVRIFSAAAENVPTILSSDRGPSGDDPFCQPRNAAAAEVAAASDGSGWPEGIDSGPSVPFREKEKATNTESDSESLDGERGGASQQPATNVAASTQAPPSPRSIRMSRPDLFFYGVVVKVAGYTSPDNETIKRLLQKHGGDLETYETERVTHIIAQQLSMAKANVYKKARRPRPVCRPSWIVDSVREGKLLPHGNYLLIEEKDQQQMGIRSMFQKQSAPAPLQGTKTARLPPPLSPQKTGPKYINPYAKPKNPPPRSDCNPSRSPQKADRNHSESEETKPRSPAKSKPENGHGVQHSPEKTGTTDRKFLNGKVRTVGTDPNFLDSYFAASRLSFIGSFKQRTASTNHPNRSVSSSPAEKLIFHVDMDCFFASVVLRNFPQYRNKPVVISHHGKSSTNERPSDGHGRSGQSSFDHSKAQQSRHIPKKSSSECATCNYEARKYGIKKGMFLGRAKELCPDLIVLDYDFRGYEEVSQQVLEILDRLARSENRCGTVEMVSCDEAYVELSFDASGGWEEVYDHASDLAESVRTEIFETTRCTASIGVGPNKFLAKLGTDRAKPNNSFCVRDHRELLKALKLRDMHGVGWRTEKKLTEEGLVSVQDVWDLGPRGESELIRILGPGTGKKIFSFTQGKDDRPITPVERKTIGAECNYGVRFDGPYGIDHFMEGLAKEVEKRMLGISTKGKRLTLKIKQRKKGASNHHKFLGHGSCHNLSKSAGTPGDVATSDSKVFKRVGMSLFREFGIEDINEIRGMGITISNLESDGATGTERNNHGMKSWLQQNIDRTAHENSSSKEKGETTNQPMDEEIGVVERVSESTPEPKKVSEIDPETEGEGNQSPANHGSPLVIDLPPMSQIKMTQVEALPQEFQKQILSRMREAGEGTGATKGGNAGVRADAGTLPVRDSSRDTEPWHGVADDEPRFDPDVLQFTPQSKGESVTDLDLEERVDGNNNPSFDSPLVIELPPMSQIQMSQVKALPPDLQQQVFSRMNKIAAGATDEGAGTIDEAPFNHSVPKAQPEGDGQGHGPFHNAGRFRQTSLKRMMKLAAVKSGHERTSISLTQLEQLPLEIKLQVVNHDDQRVGVLSKPAPRAAKAGGNDQRPRTSIPGTTDAGERPHQAGFGTKKDSVYG